MSLKWRGCGSPSLLKRREPLPGNLEEPPAGALVEAEPSVAERRRRAGDFSKRTRPRAQSAPAP
jgi:hypothetical protein